jgi:hypothetical protein
MFSLARELNRTRAELGRSISAEELPRWKALFRLENHEREQASKDAQEKQKRKRSRRG